MGYDISNEGIVIINGLDVDGVKLFFVNKCYSIFFVWIYDFDVGIIGGFDYIGKVFNIIEFFFDIS